MGQPESPIKVLSVVGAGRSGTTVLASILGEVPDFASAGELRWLWLRGIVERRPCACGLAPADCPIWGPVVGQQLEAASRPGGRSVDEIIAAQAEIAAVSRRARVLSSAAGGPTRWQALQTVREATGLACRSFAAVTDARVVIDTSKRPHDAAVIAGLPDVSHFVLHVVRDPRAVAHSWRRAKTFTVGGETHTMGTRRLPSTVRRWYASGLGIEYLRRQVPDKRWLRLRYEDFCAAPEEAFGAIMGLLDEHGQSPFESSDTVRLHPGHIVAGNPSRFTVGSVKIRVDEEWRTAMSKRDQRAVAMTTLPLLRRYGYSALH